MNFLAASRCYRRRENILYQARWWCDLALMSLRNLSCVASKQTLIPESERDYFPQLRGTFLFRLTDYSTTTRMSNQLKQPELFAKEDNKNKLCTSYIAGSPTSCGRPTSSAVKLDQTTTENK